MKSLKYIAAILIPAIMVIGCVATQPPSTGPTTQPTTQPAATTITPAQVAGGAADAVLAYGPAAQVILAAIPSTAGAALGVGIAMTIAAAYKKYSASGQPFNFADAAEFVAAQVATAFPTTAKTGTEIAALAKVVEAALTAHVASAATA